MWIETLELVQAAVGDAAAIAVRIGVDLTPGLDVDEALAFIRLADPLVDLWDVNVGSIALWSHDSGASRFFAEGYQLEWTARVREATAKPIVGVGRFTSPDRMVEMISSGAMDLIGAARPSIADPVPAAQDRGGALRRHPRVHRLQRLHFEVGVGSSPRLHAERDRRRGVPARLEPGAIRAGAANADRDVLVVGAGPAGMECAIVLAKRGFRRVHLVDREARDRRDHALGAAAPGLGEWARVVNWRRIQLEKLKNVEVFTGLATRRRRGVLTYGAELVIVATGSHWAGDGLNAITHEPIPGADATLPVGSDARAGDDRGQAPARQPCRRVRRRGLLRRRRGSPSYSPVEGYDVELVTPFDVVAPVTDETLEGPLLRRRLHDAGITMHRNVDDDRGSRPASSRARPSSRRRSSSRPMVSSSSPSGVSNDALYHALRADPRLADEGVEAVYRIGDCVAPRMIAECIFDGHRLGREIDSPHPAVPLPFKRERMLVTGRSLP